MLDFGEFMADITVERQYCNNSFLCTLLSSCHQAVLKYYLCMHSLEIHPLKILDRISLVWPNVRLDMNSYSEARNNIIHHTL